MNKLRIGFIGAGLIAHGHALALRALIEGNSLPGAQIELAKVYDLHEAKAAIFAEQHGFTAAVSTVEDLLGDTGLDAVYICTPTAYHKQYFLQAAEAGKHIFVEKPLAFSLDEIKEMAAAHKKAGIMAQVGLVLRFEPVFWYLKNLIERGKDKFGSLLSFYFRSDQEWPLSGSFHDSAWRANPQEALAGCLFEHSIHDVDLIRHLFGEITELSAFVGYHAAPCAGKIEDAVTVNLALADGSAGNLTSMYHHIKGRDVRRLEIFYERAAIILDDYTPGGFDRRFRELMVEVSGEKRRMITQAEIDQAYFDYTGRPSLLCPELVSAYRYQALAFLRALLTGGPVFPGLEVALEAHRLIESVYSFARRKQDLSSIPV